MNMIIMDHTSKMEWAKNTTPERVADFGDRLIKFASDLEKKYMKRIEARSRLINRCQPSTPVHTKQAIIDQNDMLEEAQRLRGENLEYERVKQFMDKHNLNNKGNQNEK